MSKTTLDTPFLDLVSPHLELEDELVGVFREALRGAKFIGGHAVESFERNFASFCGAADSIGVGSGTDALRFALIASGVKAGDAVITVANTFIATTEAITQSGAHPVFVDIDEATFNMDPAALSGFLKTKCAPGADGRPVIKENGRTVSAVIPVHLYGQPCDMDPISETAAKYKIKIVEDACQAHGAQYYSAEKKSWLNAGSMGASAAFSFYPGKNLGACGEGGAVTTNDEAIAGRVRMLRDHGQIKKYHHEIEGFNGRLDSIQAGILDVKLKHLRKWNGMRRECAARYEELLGASGHITTPRETANSKGVYHLYVIRVKDREGLQRHLSEMRVSTGLHYPVPLHMQKAYSDLGYKKGDLPATERVSEEILSLPMYPGLRPEQQHKVAEIILSYF